MKNAAIKRCDKTVLITGGAGFVGANLANHFLSKGYRVRILDSLLRKGVESNLQWLLRRGGDQVEFFRADIRDPGAVEEAVAGVEMIYHLAAQVAVTSSLMSPVEDFEVNARGTLNVLEAMRRQHRPPALLFTSTNKVYGAVDDLVFNEKATRYVANERKDQSISERRYLDFHSSYGCSKGAAEQYVRDYGRSFGLRTIVFRMSCIYGPHQFGNEDQGWVAHFLIRSLEGQPIVVFGNGKQVRDILFVDDLVAACWLAFQEIHLLAGGIFNIGGGFPNTISLLELLRLIEDFRGPTSKISFGNVREGDQRYFVSDTSAFCRQTGWRAKMSVERGVKELHQWLVANRRRLTESDLTRAAA